MDLIFEPLAALADTLVAKKDYVDVFSKGLTAIGVFIGALTFLLTWRTRRQDFQWRKATAARDALSDIHKNEWAVEAIHIVDCLNWNEMYRAPDKLSKLQELPSATIVRILDVKTDLTESETEAKAYVRRCFDWLLYYIDRAAYISTHLKMEDQLLAPLVPYAVFIVGRWDTYFKDLNAQENYVNAPLLLARLAQKDIKLLVPGEDRHQRG